MLHCTPGRKTCHDVPSRIPQIRLAWGHTLLKSNTVVRQLSAFGRSETLDRVLDIDN